MKDLSLQELLALVKEDNNTSQTAFAELSERYFPLLSNTVLRLCGKQDAGEYEDMLQEATLALYHAAIAYDLTQNKVSFGLYAKVCISNYIISRMRKSGRLKQHYLYSLEELRELGVSADYLFDEQSDPSDLIIDKESFRLLKCLIHENLSDFENKVFALYMGGHSAKDIAASLGKSHKSIDNAICRIRVKLKKLLC
ncbi:MAG: sigma-70 family RNA polymerase sigma factor [Clostridiales bacterium]|nr:sigma-70 family RNA polymerase sigma factor [Clostridiales bacterium]